MTNYRRLLCCAVSAALLTAVPASAGNYDMHLAMTHYLARRAGLDEKSAALIARADWSMDENRSTTAMPLVHYEGFFKIPKSWIDDTSLTDHAGTTGWKERGTTHHSFGKDVAAVRANLERLRNAIPGPEAGQEARLRGVGQYLHAMQDVYFHQSVAGPEKAEESRAKGVFGIVANSVLRQTENTPYGPVAGHILSGQHGHAADKVPLRFDATLMALDETAKVMAAVQQGQPIPDIDWGRAYAPRAYLSKSFEKSFDLEIVKLASAVARAYDSYDSKKPYEIDNRVLDANLRGLWSLQGHTEPFQPFLELTTGDRAVITYDTHPDWLIVRAPEPQLVPGGISFSEAAASRMPINLSLDGILIDKGRLVMTGRSAGDLKRFDAAQLLTGFRLACTHGDPYFSLDPADPALWKDAGGTEVQTYLRNYLETQVNPPAIDPFDDPRIGTASFDNRYVEGRSPTLQTKLVFSPEWLRATRFGKVLYDADVLLKVLASGMAMTDGTGPSRAPALPGYHSAAERAVVNRLLSSIDGGKQPSHDGSRLWFQLADVTTPPPFANYIPAEQAFPNLDFLISPSPQTGHEVFISALKTRLRQAGLTDGSDDFAVSANYSGSTVSVSGTAMDLESVWPRMFVRRHDLGTGVDLAGDNPELKSVAHDVNSRMREWSGEYPELGSLVNALRIYVAAVKITSADRSICKAVARIPMMPSEMLETPLPATRPAITSIATLSIRVAGDAGGAGEVLAAGYGYVSGGVSLAVKNAPGSVTYVDQRTPIIDALLSAPDGVSDSGDIHTIAFNMDLVETATGITRFVPVTEADVLGAGTTIAGNWRTLLRQRAARWLVDPFAGIVVMLPLLGLLVFAAGAFLKLFHRGPLFGTRGKSR